MNLLLAGLAAATTKRAFGGGTRGARRDRHVQHERQGHFIEQATRPQTIGYALLASPVALASWMLDHDTDSYYKISRAFLEDQPAGNLTPERVLDNITLYWLTGTGELGRPLLLGGCPGRRRRSRPSPHHPFEFPVGFTTFPGEIFRAPRSWVEKAYPNVSYFNEVDKGGRLAAWEEPELFSEELGRQSDRCASQRLRAGQCNEDVAASTSE